MPCSRCQKLFNNAWFLHQHELRVHSGEKRKLRCPRKGCNKEFTRHFNLESHLQGEHEGKRPFSCAHAGCGKSFAMKVKTGKRRQEEVVFDKRARFCVISKLVASGEPVETRGGA